MLTVEKQQFDLLVNGELVAAASGKYFELVNPSTGEVFARVADATPEDIQKAISNARSKFDQGAWRNMSMAERGIYLRKIADLIRKSAKELADLESANIGKTLKQSSFIDVPAAADCFEYFGSLETLAKDRQNSVTDPVKSLTA